MYAAALEMTSMISELENSTPLPSVSTVVPRTAKTWMPIQLHSIARLMKIVCFLRSGSKSCLKVDSSEWWTSMSKSRPNSTASWWRPLFSSFLTYFMAWNFGDSRSLMARTAITIGREGGDEEGVAPPDGGQQHRRQGRPQQHPDRPAALHQAVDEPAPRVVAVHLVEVGGVHRLLGVAEAGEGPHHHHVGPGEARRGQARQAGA